MKISSRLWCIALVMLTLPAGLKAQEAAFFNQADLFFQKHVANGRVDYRLVGQDMDGFNSLTNKVATANWKSWPDASQKAFLINAYNLMVIKQIIDNYPLSSVQEVNGFFERTKHDVGGEKMTLDYIENKLIRPVYNDPRAHFALVCGARGCPPIIDHAYRPDALEKQLEKQAIMAMNDPLFVRVDSRTQTVKLSQIFKWFPDDFKAKAESNVAYVNLYRDEPLPADYRVDFYDYDWSINAAAKSAATGTPGSGAAADSDEPQGSNVQTYTPSVLLKKDQVEIKMFNNLYTQNAWFNPEGEKSYLGQRQTFYTAIFQFLYGASDNGRFNAGFDVNVKGVFYDSDSAGSPLKVLNPVASDTNRLTLTSLGPKIKFSPIKKLDHFSIQSAFWIPVGSDLEQQPWIDRDRYTWWNQFFYDHTFLERFQVFTEIDALFWLSKDRTQAHQVQTPMSLFLSWFPNGRSTVYAMVQYAPTYAENPYNSDKIEQGEAPSYRHWFQSEWAYTGYFAQTGFGGKYQVLPNLEIEALYTNFFSGDNGGAGATYNIGLRFLR